MYPTTYPGAIPNPIPNRSGLNYIDAPLRLVLHATVTAGLPRYTSPPHVTINPITGAVWQHVPFDRGAYALLHPRGTPETNRMGALQIEIIDKDGDASEWNKSQHLAAMLQWFTTRFPIRRTGHPVFSTSRCYGPTTSCRMLDDEWELFDGICGHQHVPDNYHWDPGPLDVDALLNMQLGDPDMTTQHEQEHPDARELQIAHRSWADIVWPAYVAAGGTSVAGSRGWRTSREDFASFWERSIVPLERAVEAQRLEIRTLQQQVATLALQVEALTDHSHDPQPHDHPEYLQNNAIVRLEETT